MSLPPHDRVYSEEEISRILKRAADLQGKQGRKPVLGLSLPELQQLARESDIDPQFIEAAALELAGFGESDESTLFGGPLTLSIKRRIEGIVSPDAFDRMVSEARRSFKKSGKASEVGTTREWTTESDTDASISFSLRERDGYTEFEMFWTESPILPIPFIAFPIVAFILSLAIVLEGIGLEGPAALAALIPIAVLYPTISRFLFARVTRSHRREVNAFVDTVMEIVAQERHRLPDRDAPARSPAAEEQSRLQLDDNVDDPADGEARPSRQQER